MVVRRPARPCCFMHSLVKNPVQADAPREDQQATHGGPALGPPLADCLQCPNSERFLLKRFTLAVDYDGHGFLLMLDEREKRNI